MCYCLTHWAIPWYMWPSILYFILSRFYYPCQHRQGSTPKIQTREFDVCVNGLNLISNLISSPGFYLWWIVLSSPLHCVWTYPLNKKRMNLWVCAMPIYMVNGEWFFHSLYCIWCGMHSVFGFVLRQGSTRFLDRLPFHVCFVCDDLNLHPSNLNLNNLNFDPRC